MWEAGEEANWQKLSLTHWHLMDFTAFYSFAISSQIIWFYTWVDSDVHLPKLSLASVLDDSANICWVEVFMMSSQRLVNMHF